MGMGRKAWMAKAITTAKEEVSLFSFRKMVGVLKSRWLYSFTLCSKTFQRHGSTPPSELVQERLLLRILKNEKKKQVIELHCVPSTHYAFSFISENILLLKRSKRKYINMH